MIDLALLRNSKPINKLLVFILAFIAFLIIVPIFLMLVGTILWGKDVATTGLANGSTPLSYHIFFQLFTQIGVFALGAWFFARLNSNQGFNYLGLRKIKGFQLLIFPTIAIILAIPLTSWLLQISMSFPIPDSMQSIIETMKQQETAGNNMMMKFLNVEGFGWLLFNVFFLALVPAICEELLFRGALMGVLSEIFKSKHVVVLLSAIVFSAIHLQFFSFLSRFGLGLILGYAYVYSGSIIPSIIAHFANNAISVIGYFYQTTYLGKKDLNEIGTTDNYWVLAITSFFAVLMILLMRKKAIQNESFI